MLDFKEVDMRSIKNMGGIGAILTLVAGWVPHIGWLLSLAGLVLVLLALRKLADETNRRTIFTDYLIAVIFTTVGNFLVSLLGAFTLLSSAAKGFKGFEFGAVFFAFLLGWVVLIIGAYFIRLCFDTVAEITDEDKFSLAGTLIFWGAVLVIVFFLGAIVSFIGEIVEAVAFFSLPDTLEFQT